MNGEQVGLFDAPPAAPPAPIRTRGEVVYEAVPKPGGKWAINWSSDQSFGVVGGWYTSEEEALSCIEFRKQLHTAGIEDPRPWMRIPPAGVHP